jgi:hypothetical protein
VITEEVLGTGQAVQLAERLEEDNPDWVIMYGSYSREYVAFPVYADAPDNSYCSAKDPAALDDHIRETERRHGRVRLTGRRAVLPLAPPLAFVSEIAAAARRFVNTVTSVNTQVADLAQFRGQLLLDRGKLLS